MNFFVTTSLKASEKLILRAGRIAKELGILYVPRGSASLEDIERKYSSDGILVVSKERLVVYSKGETFFFHPNMAKMRIKALTLGKTDYMVSAMNLKPEMTVLDCTLGLGSDAIVASYVVGKHGFVTGLEINPLVAYVLREEMGKYENKSKALMKAVRGVRVLNADHNEYLKELPDNSVDIVYFDPMFKDPVYHSCGISSLRKLADYTPMRVETIREACRVARFRVVMKERTGSSEFKRLGFEEIVGGRRSRIAYGVINLKGER